MKITAKTKSRSIGFVVASVWLLVGLSLPIGLCSQQTAHAAEGVSEQVATFEEEGEVVFEEEGEASFSDEEAAGFQEETGGDTAFRAPAAGFSAVTGLPSGPVNHVGRYQPPAFFPDRQNRYNNQMGYAWGIPLLLILGMVPLVLAGSDKTVEKPQLSIRFMRYPFQGTGGALKTHDGRAKILQIMIVTTLAAMLFFVSSSYALNYFSVKDAVISYLGKGQKVYQAKIPMTPEARAYLQETVKWAPNKEAYKVYYVKSEDGKPQRYAFVLEDRLVLCGGLHKYCVAINADGTVAGVKILELTCDRSYSINTRSFLSQFKKFDIRNFSEKAKSYDGISGATLSTDLTRHIVQRALALFQVMMNGQTHG